MKMMTTWKNQAVATNQLVMTHILVARFYFQDYSAVPVN
jgi:hypothetical protein